ncbi:MAG: hypothetical protein QW261_06755 [Candidatus Jordarchaeaceae archaeon]
MRRVHLVVLGFAILGLMLGGIATSSAKTASNSALSAILASASKPSATLTPAFASDGVNQVSPQGCLPGDIIILGTPDSFFDYLIPGQFQHTVIYCGQVQPGEQIWDRTHKQWMPVGTHYVIHSTKSSEQGNGLGYDTWEVAVNAHADEALVLRVLKPGGVPLTASERQAIVNFLKSQLTGGTDGYPVGPPYDWGWLYQQELASEPNPLSGVSGYYCSEAAWGAYKHVLGIDLDSETSPLDIGVSPDDLLHSQYTSVIAGEVGSATWSAANGVYKLTVFVDEIYYDDDYDPWPKGAGEEYIKSFSGDGIYPTEEGYPGSGKIGLCPEGWWSRDGAGPLDWNKYFYALISYDRDAKVRIEAWEDDDIDGDDQYPTWQWYWSPSQWHQYINKGWYWSGYRVDLGDCRYTVYFRIDSVSW